MRIWIDLANSPHVPLFRALSAEFIARGHEVIFTARRFAQTVEMAEACGLRATVIGEHGGKKLAGKGSNLLWRAWELARWARGRRIDLAVGHNSYAQIVAARALGIRCATMMDYEHQPANHLAFRLAHRVIVPAAFPCAALRRCGASPEKVRHYCGIKEDVYLADWEPNPRFADELQRAFGIAPHEILVVARPPARDALYHRFENALFDALLAELGARKQVRVILIARTAEQRAVYARRFAPSNIIVVERALDGLNLIAAADLVISAGGTMNREAAALGVPALSVYAGRWAAVDDFLMREGRLQRISTRAEIENLSLRKRSAAAPPRRCREVRAQVVELVLGAAKS